MDHLWYGEGDVTGIERKTEKYVGDAAVGLWQVSSGQWLHTAI